MSLKFTIARLLAVAHRLYVNGLITRESYFTLATGLMRLIAKS